MKKLYLVGQNTSHKNDNFHKNRIVQRKIFYYKKTMECFEIKKKYFQNKKCFSSRETDFLNPKDKMYHKKIKSFNEGQRLNL